MEEPFRNNRQQEQITTIMDTSTLLEKRDSPFVRIKKQFEQIRGNFMLLLSPGDKQFKDLSKRVRLMVVSFLIPLVFAVVKFMLPTYLDEAGWWIMASFVLGVFAYAGVYWGVKAQVRKEALYSVMSIPSLFVISYSMFMFVLFEGPINRVYLWALFIAAIATYMILLYIITLAINILNVTLFYTIPLSRLGESVAYMVGVITIFFTVYASAALGMGYLLDRNFILAAIVVIICFLMIAGVTRYLWLYFIPYKRGLAVFILAISAFLTILVVGFGALLPSVWQVATSASAIAYILYGHVIHKEQNTLKPMVIAEFFLIILALLVFLLSV